MTDELNIAELLRQAHAGDRRSLDLLLSWLRQCVRPWAQRQLQNRRLARVDASDVTQEVCLRVYRTLDHLRDGCTAPELLGWARAILNNLVIDCHRRARPEVADAALLAGLENDTTAPEQRVLRRERQALLEHALQRLPQEQRLAFQLRLREGLTFQEIGGRLGMPLGRARVLFLRAVERLRGELAEQT